LEPNLNIKVNKALYSQNTGVISPYELGIAYGEVAFDNGVAFKLEETVEDIKKINKGFKVETNKNKFTCKMVINTTPEDYNIDGFKEKVCEKVGDLKYFLIEKSFKGCFSNMVFSYNKDEIVYVCPTVQGNYIAAIKTKENLSYEECYTKVKQLVNGLKPQDINTFYETPFYDDTIVIDDSLVHKGYIKVTGKNYAEVTMTPSIGKIICETVVSNLNCKIKSDFNDKRREIYRFIEMSNEERQKIITLDKRYGKMVCECNNVTEGEIVDCIRRPLGAVTVKDKEKNWGGFRKV
jgi:L-2-hydroxyglutarate oxidase LhgO